MSAALARRRKEKPQGMFNRRRADALAVAGKNHLLGGGAQFRRLISLPEGPRTSSPLFRPEGPIAVAYHVEADVACTATFVLILFLQWQSYSK